MAWVYLLLAGVFEIAFTTCLKMSDGLTKFWPTTFFFASSVVSFGLLTMAMKTIPLGTAYAVWTGIGAAGTAVIGILFFKDPLTAGRVVFLALLVGSIIGLKLISSD